MTREREPQVHDNPLDMDYEPPLPPGEKRRTLLIVGFILLSVTLAAVAQLTLKTGVDRITVNGHSGIELSQPIASAIRVAKQPMIWLGLALFGVSAVFWLVVLSRVSLSFAYPFAALTYVLILLADRLILHVRVPGLRWVGVALIMSGIVMVGLTRHS
jgi:multidrug transporter EmrE-like cation transporter